MAEAANGAILALQAARVDCGAGRTGGARVWEKSKEATRAASALVSGIAKLALVAGVVGDAGGAGVCAGAVDAGGVNLRAFSAGVGVGIGGVISGQAVGAGIAGVARGTADADGAAVALQAVIADDVARTAFTRIRIEPHVAARAASICVAQCAAVAKRYGEPDGAESAIGG